MVLNLDGHSRRKMTIKAKSASNTAPIVIPTIAPADNLRDNKSVRVLRLTSGNRFLTQSCVPMNDVSSKKIPTRHQKISHLFSNEEVVYTCA